MGNKCMYCGEDLSNIFHSHCICKKDILEELHPQPSFKEEAREKELKEISNMIKSVKKNNDCCDVMSLRDDINLLADVCEFLFSQLEALHNKHKEKK